MRLSLSLALLPSALLMLPACATVPPRPVPGPVAQQSLPKWYPQKPWNTEAAATAREYLEGKVVFDTGKATIRPQSEKILNSYLAYLKANPDISRLRLEGHTDSRASESSNQKLSKQRAMAVADWFVDHGLDHNRLLAVAFGETRPLGPNKRADGRQENRRVAMHIAEVGGRRFQGKEPTNGGLVLNVKSKAEREAELAVGEVPQAPEPPPFTPEGDIIKPAPKPKLEPLMKDSIEPADGGPADEIPDDQKKDAAKQ